MGFYSQILSNFKRFDEFVRKIYSFRTTIRRSVNGFRVFYVGTLRVHRPRPVSVLAHQKTGTFPNFGSEALTYRYPEVSDALLPTVRLLSSFHSHQSLRSALPVPVHCLRSPGFESRACIRSDVRFPVDRLPLNQYLSYDSFHRNYDVCRFFEFQAKAKVVFSQLQSL